MIVFKYTNLSLSLSLNWLPLILELGTKVENSAGSVLVLINVQVKIVSPLFLLYTRVGSFSFASLTG